MCYTRLPQVSVQEGSMIKGVGTASLYAQDQDENRPVTTQSALKELQVIPGIGKKMAEGLWNLGIHSVSDLNGRDPEELYLRLCDQSGMKVDRCVLYTYRCAIYYASNEQL